MSTPNYKNGWEESGEDFSEGLMTRRAIARFLSVSTRTVRRMEARGTLTRVEVPGVRMVFYPRAEVEALIRGGTVTRPTRDSFERWRHF